MFFKFKSYFYFLSKSTNQHGVHSPFVFSLITKCFYKKNSKETITRFLNYKNNLLSNTQIISITDFGAGSKVFKSNQRQISKIAKYAGITKKRAFLLSRIVTYFKPKNILEIGTSLGISTTAMHLGNENTQITSLEGCPETAAVAQQQFDQHQFSNINLVVGNFNTTLEKSVKNQQFDLIYFDGNHQKEATLQYFETCIQSAHNDSVFIFDDIHWSKEMEIAWQEIKKHPSVTVSIDTYQWGIVFFRKEQEKEHFTIRV